MKMRVKDLCEQGEKLFSNRRGLLSLWQSICEQVYPERADFITTRYVGAELADHLMTGFPSMCRRDLANQIGTMLRPKGARWFHPATDDEEINDDQNAKLFFDWMGDIQYRAMYDDASGFRRATNQGDNDFSALGQCVIQIDPNKDYNGLLYRNWHVRDVAWAENESLVIDRVHRKQKLPARDIVRYFTGRKGGAISAKVTQCLDKEPFKEFNIQHIILPAADYDLSAKQVGGRKFVSIYIDKDNETILEEIPQKRLRYVIPRWQTLAGSQYAFSPATVIALSDSRMLQRMALTLVEAGEKAVDPPLIATREAVIGGIQAYAGGVTYVSAEYDEKLGEALRQMTVDKSGLQWGLEREQATQEMIMRAFYLNQIQLPEVTGDMTAYETQKRVEEYVRNALPLFEPMEVEYNGALCSETLELMIDMGAFGNFRENAPQILSNREIRFTFDSPIQEAQSRANSKAFLEASQLLSAAMALDPSVKHVFDIEQATRDGIEGTGAPAKWLIPKETSDEARAQEAQAMAEAESANAAMAEVGMGADVAARAGDAMQSINQALGAGI